MNVGWFNGSDAFETYLRQLKAAGARTATPIELPWFPKHCHPNARSRSHWPRTRAVKQARKDAWAATKKAMPGCRHDGSPVALIMTFHPPTAHSRDDDGLIAATKAYRDGIADALGCDDSCFRVHPPIIAEPVKNGRVVIVLGEGS